MNEEIIERARFLKEYCRSRGIFRWAGPDQNVMGDTIMTDRELDYFYAGMAVGQHIEARRRRRDLPGDETLAWCLK